jgi:spore coat protein H
MFRDAGVPTPRATNARFKLNNRDLGFYVVKEGWTKEFLGMYFKNTKGNLYDGLFCRDINSPIQKESGDDAKGQPDIDKLVRASRIEDRQQRWTELQKVLDTDRFLTFMALEILSCDWDGYVMKPNNYRVYHDPPLTKSTFFPMAWTKCSRTKAGRSYSPNAMALSRAL